MQGKTIYDRMISADPLQKVLAPRLQAMIDAINEIGRVSIAGQNPHKVNDTANVLTLTTANDVDTAVDLYQEVITRYEAHIDSTAYHLAADTTNVVTEVGVPQEIYTLLNEIKTDYELNRVNTTSHHGATDDVNTVSAADADTKAKAIILSNDLKTQLNAHMATLESVHGAEDAANPVVVDDLDSDATWEAIATTSDALRTAYEAHRQLTAGSVHAGVDSTNTVTAAAIGAFATAVYAGINELKADFNAHAAEFGTFHAVKDYSNTIPADDASSEVTLITLANAIGVSYPDHISRADNFVEIPSLRLEE